MHKNDLLNPHRVAPPSKLMWAGVYAFKMFDTAFRQKVADSLFCPVSDLYRTGSDATGIAVLI